MGRRVLLGEDALGLQIGELLIAGIAQEQRLAAVTNEHHGIMGYCEPIHVELLTKSVAAAESGYLRAIIGARE
jgi:hypothetical protein